MPLTGFDEEPSSPVMREDTTEKKNPKITMMTAESSATNTPGTACSCGRNAMKSARPSEPKITSLKRQVALGAPRWGAVAVLVARRSRNDGRNESTMVGIAFTRLMMPPAATAPAPM